MYKQCYCRNVSCIMACDKPLNPACGFNEACSYFNLIAVNLLYIIGRGHSVKVKQRQILSFICWCWSVMCTLASVTVCVCVYVCVFFITKYLEQSLLIAACTGPSRRWVVRSHKQFWDEHFQVYFPMVYGVLSCVHLWVVPSKERGGGVFIESDVPSPRECICLTLVLS